MWMRPGYSMCQELDLNMVNRNQCSFMHKFTSQQQDLLPLGRGQWAKGNSRHLGLEAIFPPVIKYDMYA